MVVWLTWKIKSVANELLDLTEDIFKVLKVAQPVWLSG